MVPPRTTRWRLAVRYRQASTNVGLASRLAYFAGVHALAAEAQNFREVTANSLVLQGCHQVLGRAQNGRKTEFYR